MRRPGQRAHVIGAMTFDLTRTSGIVYYSWAEGDTFIVGEGMEAVIVVEWPGSAYQTFPTVGYISVDVSDNIETETADLLEDTELPPTTPALYGDGYWPWTPLVEDAGVPVSGASVSVITGGGTTYGPATTDANGQCIASDGYGAFRLDPGTYTLTITKTGVTITQVLTIDDDGNGVTE